MRMKDINVNIARSSTSDASLAVFSKGNIRRISAFSLGTCAGQDAHMEGV